ncbi:hypothetical protein D6817_02080, partial [Candidatus Pacearchaeota archaeon]
MLITRALRLMEKEDDGSGQIAYLLIDVGVETTLKVFLSLPGRDKSKSIDRAHFPSLVEAVWEVAGEDLKDIDP